MHDVAATNALVRATRWSSRLSGTTSATVTTPRRSSTFSRARRAVLFLREVFGPRGGGVPATTIALVNSAFTSLDVLTLEGAHEGNPPSGRRSVREVLRSRTQGEVRTA